MGNAKGEKRDFEALERRRLKAVKLFQAGYSQSEVAEKLGVVRQTTHRWHAAWKAGGAKKLKGAGRAGRKPRLSEKDRSAVIAALKEGAVSHGYSNELWTTLRISKMIEEVTGVSYHPDHVGRLLRQFGWSCQRPERRTRERNEEKIIRWKKKEWPRIKKKPGKRGAQSSSSMRAD